MGVDERKSLLRPPCGFFHWCRIPRSVASRHGCDAAIVRECFSLSCLVLPRDDSAVILLG